MPSISTDISLKVANLLKISGKVSEQGLVTAKQKYEGNGQVPLGVLHYLLEAKVVNEEDIVAVISRNYAIRKIELTEKNIQNTKSNPLAINPIHHISLNVLLSFSALLPA